MVGMTTRTRRQLTLFVNKNDAIKIEAIREKFNPLQYALIDSHVTLCREDEIEDIDQVMANLRSLDLTPITILFGPPQRFDQGKGVLLPAVGDNAPFHALRKAVMEGISDNPRKHEPHITLMHPRNATCTNSVFEQIIRADLPIKLEFGHISLIQQTGDGAWQSILRLPN
jgi:2'-5' RNA ligase